MIGSVVMLYSWCILDTLVYWISSHVMTPELVWGLASATFIFLVVSFSGGKGGSSHAAPKPAGGGGGGHH